MRESELVHVYMLKCCHKSYVCGRVYAGKSTSEGGYVLLEGEYQLDWTNLKKMAKFCDEESVDDRRERDEDREKPKDWSRLKTWRLSIVVTR